MNQQQRKHVIRRLESIKNKKTSALSDKLRIEAEKRERRLTPTLLLKGIKDGSIPLLPKNDRDTEVSRYTDIEDVFDISSFFGEYDETPLDDLETKLQEEIYRIEDELYLGDEADALAMIKAFETFK